MANRKEMYRYCSGLLRREKKMIRKRMILSKTSNMSVYLRKMAIDGMIVNTDTTYLKAMYQEMHKIGCEHQPACQSCKHRRYCPHRKI